MTTTRNYKGETNRYSKVPHEHPDHEVVLSFTYKTPYEQTVVYDEDFNRISDERVEGEEVFDSVSITINGSYYGSFGKGVTPDDNDVEERIAQYEKDRDEYEAAVVRTSPLAAMRDTAPGQPLGVEDAEVGQVAWVHAKGKWRQGRVSKVGRSRVTVEYYVASSGSVTEKAGTAKKPVHVE